MPYEFGLCQRVSIGLVLLSCEREAKEIPAIVFGASSNRDDSKEFRRIYMERNFSGIDPKYSGDLLVW
jgi:hypothetical protein